MNMCIQKEYHVKIGITLPREEKGLEQILPLYCQGEPSPADTLISDFWPPELGENNFLLFKPPGLWSLVRDGAVD